MKTSFYLSGIFICCLAVIGCGGSSGSDQPLVRIVSPLDDQLFTPGDSMTLMVETSSFTLRAPGNLVDIASTGSTGGLAREALLFHEDSHSEQEPHSESDHQSEDDIEQEVVEHHGEQTTTAEPELAGHGHDSSEESDEHGHDQNTTNPFADGGHMHIYLDGSAGNEPHLTSWSQQTTVVLPTNLSPGMHSLRIELRDDSHILVGAEHDQVMFFSVVHETENHQ